MVKNESMSRVISETYPCILLVNTDDSFSQRASLALQEAGYTTVLVSDVSTAMSKFQEVQPEMVVIDKNSTGVSGLKFCQQLRSSGHRLPILILVATETVEERVALLEAGADDYLLKPYHIKEFLLQVQLYLQSQVVVKEQLTFSELILDLTTRRVIRNGRTIDLTMKEFELLKYLMSHPREVLTREQILENVWGYNFHGESNVIEVYIRYLRLKIEDEGERRLIQTVRGIGYVLRES